jgi:membrane-bound lytic murein transglycosylase B
MLSDARRTQGAALYQQHLPVLMDVEARTGVPGNVMVALWGIESNFGANMGTTPVIPALVTLAWRSPRGEYFAKEAMQALRVAAQQHIEPQALVGSWAGAMGGCQFMPSNYLAYAVDGDGDGSADIWKTPADVFASSGNFLHELGWQQGKPWRVKARATAVLPQAAGFNERGLSKPWAIAQWQRWGVIPLGQTFAELGGMDTAVRLYQPMGSEGPLYMLGGNFDVILKWNKSSYFAASVLLLAESIAKNGEMPHVE